MCYLCMISALLIRFDMIFKELVLAVCSTNSQYVVFKDILSISFLNVTKKKRSSWYN